MRAVDPHAEPYYPAEYYGRPLCRSCHYDPTYDDMPSCAICTGVHTTEEHEAAIAAAEAEAQLAAAMGFDSPTASDDEAGDDHDPPQTAGDAGPAAGL